MTGENNQDTDIPPGDNYMNLSGEGQSRPKIHEIEDRLSKNESEIEALKGKVEERRKYWLGRLEVIGRLLTAAVLAVATYLGATVIPKTIHRQSLESQKIIQLSQLVPKLYEDSTAVYWKPLLISMASHGAPAVPFLLLVLEDANDSDETELIRAIVSAMKYMDDEARNEMNAKLDFEISQLSEHNLGSNVAFISHIIDILTSRQPDKTTRGLLEEYFTVAGNIAKNRRMLKRLNGMVLKVLAENGASISGLPLDGLDFEGQDLSGIDFSYADLSRCNLANCKLTDCTFEGSILDSCNLEQAMFFLRQHDSLQVLSIFKDLSNAQWRNSFLDSTVIELLNEITRENGREDKISELVRTLMEES